MVGAIAKGVNFYLLHPELRQLDFRALSPRHVFAFVEKELKTFPNTVLENHFK